MSTDLTGSLLNERMKLFFEAAEKPFLILHFNGEFLSIISSSFNATEKDIFDFQNEIRKIDFSLILPGGVFIFNHQTYKICQIIRSFDDNNIFYGVLLKEGELPISKLPELNFNERANKVVVKKDTGQIHSASKGFCEIFDFGWSELLGTSVSDIFGIKTQELLAKGVSSFKGKLSLTSKGGVKWGNIKVLESYIIEDKEFLILNFDDLTESHLRSLQYFQMMRQFGESILVVDLQSRKIIDLNNATIDLTELSQQDLLSKEIIEILPDLYPISDGGFSVWVKTIKELSNSGENYIKRCTLKSKHSKITVEASVHYHYLDNKGYFTVLLRDITRQLKSEFSLKDSKEKLQILFNNVGYGIIVTSPSDIILRVNKTFQKLSDFTEADLVGRPIESIFSEIPPLTKIDPIHRNNSNSRIVSLSNIKHKEIYISLKKSKVRSSDNGVRSHIYVLEDVTDYLMTYQKSKDQESLLESVNENLKEAIYRCIKGKGLVYANKAFLDLFGFKDLDEALTTSESELNDYYLNGDRRKSILIQARNRGYIKSAEAEFVRRDGTKWWGLLNCTVNKNANDEWIIDGAIVDISLRKEAEEKARANQDLLKSVNENIHDAIYRSTVDEKVIYANKAFLNLFGLDENINLDQINPQNLYRNKTDRNEIIREVEEKGMVRNREIFFLREDGSGFWGLTSISKMVGEDGRQYLNGAIRDITDRKIAQTNLKKKNEELKKINSQLDRFVYSASHDLRAPLTSLLGLINIAEKDKENLEQYLELMKKSIFKQDGFIKDIIDFSRNKEIPEKIERIDPGDFITEILDNLIYGNPDDRIKVNVIIENNISEIFCDSKRLSIILSNLISNSFKYADFNKERPYVNISVSADPSYAIFEIEDNGIGISEKYLGKIFDMFFRAHDTSFGSGIGLYIVKETIEKLRGKIFVESTIKKGTKFIAMVPNRK
ncbi:PAS domain-containing sensor histidine kinase [Mangrovivirga sp. M17]|uniref:histidine kinase n=1 Tax=Mangrovivirga halotolerans TaxID=2993936 RepID=A0ABT3RSZ2_9BACT|nr:PAS domain-containing sensor histidine kinase [Mangrovivirga halotolerans]MCX2744367.1 PAS domain-containing sensor histidine kinase [Mangrovivirga halotolerans]